jgi:hypothetical protein
MKKFEQRLKIGKWYFAKKFLVIRGENPKDSVLCYRLSSDKSTGWNDLIHGDKAIERFRKWLGEQ